MMASVLGLVFRARRREGHMVKSALLTRLIGSVFSALFIKKLLWQHERNVIPLSQEGELKPKFTFKKIFLFLYFSFRNPPAYPQRIKACPQALVSFPQFKKVFSLFQF
jgi:hypothetical protein